MLLRRFLPVFLSIALAACGVPEKRVPLIAPDPLPRISGVLKGDTVLGGDVVLAGDLLIPEGCTLTVDPGTTILVQPAENTKIDPEFLSPLTEILVRGSLTISGTAEMPVRFILMENPQGEEVAWAGIILDGAIDGSIDHAHIDRAESGVLCIASSPRILNCRITRSRYGVIAQQGSSPDILSNSITDGEGGVFCWWGSKPYLKGNRIADHEEEGVFVDRTSRPWLDRNEITGNAVGLALYPRDLPFDPTRVTGNGENVRWLGPWGRGSE